MSQPENKEPQEATAKLADEKRPAKKKVRGTVEVDIGRCKGCGFCIAFCPPQVLEFHADYNAHGYHYPLLKNRDACTGCDLCGLYCPDFAIHGMMIRNGRPAREEKP